MHTLQILQQNWHDVHGCRFMRYFIQDRRRGNLLFRMSYVPHKLRDYVGETSGARGRGERERERERN